MFRPAPTPYAVYEVLELDDFITWLNSDDDDIEGIDGVREYMQFYNRTLVSHDYQRMEM